MADSHKCQDCNSIISANKIRCLDCLSQEIANQNAQLGRNLVDKNVIKIMILTQRHAYN